MSGSRTSVLTFGVVEGLSEVVADAHLIENDIVVRTESIDPDYEWTIANPIRISGEVCKPAIDPPAYGEHTEELLLAHGFSAEEINRLIEGEVVFAGESN
jgi:crotonobetainyl-CoA:carnitine CoA-transferase CaiB-like acyl-CoA transferase